LNPLAPFRYKRANLRLQEAYYKKELAAFYTKIHDKKPRTRLTKADLAEDIVKETRKHLFKVSEIKRNERFPKFNYDETEGVFKDIIFSLYDDTVSLADHAEW